MDGIYQLKLKLKYIFRNKILKMLIFNFKEDTYMYYYFLLDNYPP